MRYHGNPSIFPSGTAATGSRPLANLHWDGETPPARVEQVWKYLTFKLREFRESLSNVNELYYGRHERTAHVRAVDTALREITALKNGTAEQDAQPHIHVTNQNDLKDLIQANLEDSQSLKLSPRKTAKNLKILEDFSTNIKIVVDRMRVIRSDYEEDILQQLSKYCSNYVSLGIDDDEFYVSLRSRTLSIRDIMNQFDTLLEIIQLKRNAGSVPKELYSDHDFSLDLSILVNCDNFPIIRIPSDMIQKLEDLCDISQDWLRSDKVYLDQVQKEIGQTKSKLSVLDSQSQMLKLQYDKLYSMLKEKQCNNIEDNDDHYDDVCRDISKLEATRARIDMEMEAVQKTMKNTRDSMNGVGSASTQFGSTKHQVVSGKLLNRRSSVEDNEGRATTVSAAHSSYMSRLTNEVQQHMTKLKTLQHKRHKVNRKIEEKRSHLVRYECRESEMQQLGKKLRTAARNKSRFTTQIHTLRGRAAMLEQVLMARMRPGSMTVNVIAQAQNFWPSSGSTGSSGRSIVRKVLGSKRQLNYTKLNMPPSGSRRTAGPGRSKRSADLYKAFRIVKNGIGHGWKDLIRALPYAPAKELIEINNVITAIEYRNNGQLKEQSYQALLAWYGHCGKRASVDRLCKTLRELNENRLADNIEKIVLKIDSASESGGVH